MDNSRFAGSDAVFEYLMNFVNVEKGQKTEFKLDRMRWICERLGNPQYGYRTLHVAGSKGKGSVSAMLARILEAAGYKTGLYTSPHLIRWKERISLAGEEMSEDLILSAMGEVFPIVDGKGPGDFPGDELPTYFELTTLVAFCAFRLAGCRRAVIETGLGGRLDSTNVVDSAASVITPIELEHTEWLGDSIPRIAFEKAGIIKPGHPCFLSAQDPEARKVFQAACAERASPLREVGSLVSIDDLRVDRSGTTALLAFASGSPAAERLGGSLRVHSPMIGAVQAQNMALAVLALAETEPELEAGAVLEGLGKAALPARFQVLRMEPPVVLDGAHTPNSIRLTLESFELLFPGRKALLFACAYDKKHGEMARILSGHFDRVSVTKPGTFKQSDPAAVYESFRSLDPQVRFQADTTLAIQEARTEAASENLPLLITGSFYLCSEAARLLVAQ